MSKFNILTGQIQGKLGALVGDCQAKGKKILKSEKGRKGLALATSTMFTLAPETLVIAYVVSALTKNGYKPNEKTQRQTVKMTLQNAMSKRMAKLQLKGENPWEVATSSDKSWGYDKCGIDFKSNPDNTRINISVEFKNYDGNYYGHIILGDENGKAINSWYTNAPIFSIWIDKSLVDTGKHWVLAFQNIKRGYKWFSVGTISKEVVK